MSFLFRNDGDQWHRNRFGPWLKTITILTGLTGLSAPLAAADWDLRPYVDVGAQYQSNPRFRANDLGTESATGLLLNFALPITFANQRTQALLRPRATKNFYRKDINQDIERDNYYLEGNVGHQMSRSGFGASAGYTNLDLIASEFEDGGGQGNRIPIDNRQTRWNISPYWTRQMNSANSVSVTGGVSETSYSKLSLTRFDFEYNTLSGTFTHVLNLKNRIEVQANFSKFDSFQRVTTVENDSTTNGLSAIFTNAFSKTLSFTANLGWARTQSKVKFPFGPINIPGVGNFCADSSPPPCIDESDSTNFVGNLSLRKTSEKLQYSASIGQTVSPNSNGSEVVRRTLQGRFDRNFARNFSAGLNLIAYEQEDVGARDVAGDFRRKRRYLRTGTYVSWKFRRELSLTARYRYTYSNFSGSLLLTPSLITDNTVFIGLSYRGKGWNF